MITYYKVYQRKLPTMSKLEKGKARIIKIDKQAVFEFLYEKFIDDIDLYFDINKKSNVTQSFIQDEETGDFLMLVRNDSDVLKNGIITPNLETLNKKLSTTTDSMYTSDKRYIEMSIDDVIDLIEKN